LDFEGPAVKCMSADDSMIYNMTISHGTTLQASSGNPIELLSWVAGDVPSGIFYENGAGTLDITSTDAARLFVLTNTGNWSETLSADSNGMPYQFRKVNVTECLLYNATYSVDFIFEHSGQSRELQIADWLNTVGTMTGSLESNLETKRAVGYYTEIMDAYGKMLVGSSTSSYYGAGHAYLARAKILSINWSSGEAVATGLEQLFQNITLSLFSEDGLMCVISISHDGLQRPLTDLLQTQFYCRRSGTSERNVLADNLRIPQD
jgi:hypothetical protein